MRVLSMRVLAVLASGAPVLGRRVPGGRRAPVRRLRGAGLPVLITAGSLLVVAAGSPATGGTSPSPGGATPPALAMLVPPQTGLTPSVGPGGSSPSAAPVRRLLPADVLVVSHHPLPPGTVAKVRRVPGVRAAEPVDAARVRVNGSLAAVLGVDPSAFRRFAAKPTAMNTALWSSVANGAIAVSYTMGREAKLPVGSTVEVAGRNLQKLQVGGLGTVGIPGVDAVISDATARSLGFPVGNAIVISAPGARLSTLKSRIKAAVPRTAAVEMLVLPAPRSVGGTQVTAGSATTGALLSPAQVTAFLKAALSRVGMPYVWGAAGPAAFDCSGLVQWSFARAGVAMPRVAADQARTGPAVPVSQLQPGDLLFYHFDPTAPGYISHVAIYLGKGLMIQAPQPGQHVEVVPVDLGSGFAGAVAVSPAVAAAAAGAPLG
jgi:peptidoglycan DL-endopeptidase CwlO